jgi:hypothetical protein
MADETVQLDIAEGLLEFTPRQQYHFDAPYSVFFNRRFEEVMHQLAGRDFKVIIVMLRYCDYGNNVHVSRSDLARRTGIAENHISSIIRKLERLEIINVIDRGIRYRINERYFWRGSAENHNQRRRETRRGTTTLATESMDAGDDVDDGEHSPQRVEEEER